MGASTDSDVIVLGGGHNGLVAAGYLARQRLSVLVLERRDLVGGACMTEELFPGYHFSACSYICYLLQSRIIEDLELRQHGFDVYEIDPAASSLSPTAVVSCSGETSSKPSGRLLASLHVTHRDSPSGSSFGAELPRSSIRTS